MSAVLTNDGEKFAFLSGLKQFLEDKRKVLIPCPRLAGCEINLHDLYNKVTALGGYQKVTEKDLWVILLKEYNFQNISATLSFGLKIIYQRFLEEYERVHYFGDDEGSKKTRFDVSIRLNRRSSAFITDYERRQHGLNTSYMDFSTQSRNNYERLAFSLISCLPNEVDFAINACTLLSGESRHVLRLSRCPHVLEALLLHAGVVSDDLGSLSGIADSWLKQTQHDLIRFWQNTVDNDEVLDEMLYVSALCRCASPTIVKDNSNNKKENEQCTTDDLCPTCSLPTSKRQFVRKKSSAWSSLFQSTRSSGVQDYEGQRVLQIALVLLNLSFEEFNVGLLSRSKPLVRFAFLSVHSTYSALRQTGLDILANISSKMDLLSLGMGLLDCTFKVIQQCILSPDKFDKVRGYEILGNLCRSPSNRDCVISAMDTDIYSSSIELLSLGDVELMLAALDALYHMSKLGEETCTKIMLIPGSVDTLICLITINVRALGSDHLSKIRIVKRILPSQPSSNETAQRQMQGVTIVPPLLSTPIIQPAMYRHPIPPQYQPQVRHYMPQPIPLVPQQVTQVPPPTAHVPHQSLRMPPPVSHPSQYSAHLPQQSPHVPQQTIHVTPQHLPKSPHNKLPHTTPPNPSYPVSQPTQTVSPPVATQHQTNSNPHPKVEKSVSQQAPSRVKSENEIHQTPSKPKAKSKKSEHKKETLPPKPSIVPMYTHTESQLAPPVFHYMPAPPSSIVLDKSPASFAQLWVWATYESCGNEEGSTPRVEVFADYAAAATRYGMHGTKQVLPATEFGRCLQQVFPLTASRLFKDEKGQPLYHITGIKKRPTPLPVPGHHPQNTPPTSTSTNPCKSTENLTTSDTCKSTENLTTSDTCKSTENLTTSDTCKSTENLTTSDTCKSTENLTTSDTCKSTENLTTSDTCKSTENLTTSDTTAPPSACCSSGANSSLVDHVTTTAQQPTSKNCTTVLGMNHSEKSILTKTNDSVSKNCDKPLPVDEISQHVSSAAEMSTRTNTTNSIECPVMVNHCANVDSNKTLINSELKENELKTEQVQTNHCDVIKSEPVNGNVNSEKLKDGLLNSNTAKTPEKIHNSPLSAPSKNNDEEGVKCNGEISEGEKHAMKRNLSVEEEHIHKRSKETSLVNGELEKEKPTLPLPENGHETIDAQQKAPNISPQVSPIAPQKLQKHYDQQLKTNETRKMSEGCDEATPKPLAQKRKLDQTIVATSVAPPAKIQKTSQQTPFPPPIGVPQPATSVLVRHPPPPLPHLPHHSQPPITSKPQPPTPTPSVIPQNHRNGSITPHHHPPVIQIPPAPLPPSTPQQMTTKPPVIDLMAPNASLLVLLRNSGKYHFEDSTDEKEDPISKSIRLTAVLILINICLHSNEGRSQLQRHEAWLAYLSMSSMDCSPMIAKLLSEIDR